MTFQFFFNWALSFIALMASYTWGYYNGSKRKD
jgi:hypothetical protein